MLRLLAAAVLATPLARGFYLPGAAPNAFVDDELVPLFVNALGSHPRWGGETSGFVP